MRTALGSTGTPSAVLVDADGHFRGGVANGEDLVRRLLASALTGDDIQLEETGAAAENEGEQADSIELDSVVVPRATVVQHPLDDQTVLIDTDNGATVAADQIGSLVWQVLDGTTALRDIVADIADVYATPEDVVGADVLELLQSLRAGWATSGHRGRRCSCRARGARSRPQRPQRPRLTQRRRARPGSSP